jgi:hypothetical protein
VAAVMNERMIMVVAHTAALCLDRHRNVPDFPNAILFLLMR